MGWDAWKAEFERELADVRAEGGARAALRPRAIRPSSRHPWGPRPAPRARRIGGAGAVGRAHADPAFAPETRPRAACSTTSCAAGPRTNVRPQRQDGYSIVTVTVPLGDLTGGADARSRRAGRAYGDGTRAHDARTRTCSSAGSDAPTCPRSTRGSPRPASTAATPTPRADVTSCPGAEACRLAVTQSRGLGRLLSDHLAARPDLVAEAGGLRHQDQRLPQRLRPAPRRRPRLPGQRAPGRRARPRRSTS